MQRPLHGFAAQMAYKAGARPQTGLLSFIIRGMDARCLNTLEIEEALGINLERLRPERAIHDYQFGDLMTDAARIVLVAHP